MAFLPPPPLFWPIPLTAGDQMLHECRSSVFAPWRVEWFQEVICIAQPSQHTGFRAEIKVLKSNESFAREPPVCVKRDATRDTDTRLRRKEAGVLFSHGRPGSPGVPMVLVVPGCKVEPPARVCSTKVHLIYAGLWPGELTHASILSEARSGAAEEAMGESGGAAGNSRTPAVVR